MVGRTNAVTYKPAFFAFLMGAVLLGALMGTLTFCFMDGAVLSRLAVFQSGFLSLRQSGELGSIMVKAFAGSTVYMLAVFLLGFSAVGQPFAVGVLILKGMGCGVAMCQLYADMGRQGIAFSAALILPSAVITSAALAFGAREAVVMSDMLLRVTLSDRQESGLREALRLYLAKFLTLEAVLAVAAAVECLSTLLVSEFF